MKVLDSALPEYYYRVNLKKASGNWEYIKGTTKTTNFLNEGNVWNA